MNKLIHYVRKFLEIYDIFGAIFFRYGLKVMII